MLQLELIKQTLMFGLFKKKDQEPVVEPEFVVVNLNARIMPLERGEIFEDLIDLILKNQSIGEVAGGGTLQMESGEIENCDIEIQVKASDKTTIDFIKSSFEKIGVPKGSKIHIEKDDSQFEFEQLEGLAIYLNGTDLADSVYQNSDSNFVYSELDRLTKGIGKVYSHWQGPQETALYLYGSSYTELKSRIAEFVATYPLCEKCRIEQIA